MTTAVLEAPAWLSHQGGNVRAYDRRLEREVHGPHPFARTTDLLLTNGLVRFWVGNAGLEPFVNFEALGAGSWRESGVLALAEDDSADVLLSSRLLSVTPDEGSVEIVLANRGPVVLTLRRGERFIRIQHGSDRNPVSGSRYVRWLGTPPAITITDETDDGKFGAGHRQAAGDRASEFRLPPGLADSDLTIAFWWLPTAASTTQPDSGLASIFDTADERAVHTRFDTSDNKIRLTVGSTTVASSALVFAADEAVFVAISRSITGWSLTVGAETVTAAETGAGTSLDYSYLTFASGGEGTWGEGTWGEGTWGGQVPANGVVDNPMVFDAALDSDALAALRTAGSGLAGLAGIEGSLIWYAPFDIRPVVPPAAMSMGRVVQATAGLDGLRRFVASLDPVLASDFGLFGTDTVVRFAAGVLIMGEDAADLQSQLASETSNEVRVR